MAIRGKIGTKITINPIYMTNRRCLVSFGKIEDLVANPGDLTNFAPNGLHKAKMKNLRHCVSCLAQYQGEVVLETGVYLYSLFIEHSSEHETTVTII